ncbi:MAG: hypothetical protein IT384_09115 [Deltaproteobacteria bacterium]|nr:hypothetical protein [Deltaproteobacteria bacterium]
MANRVRPSRASLFILAALAACGEETPSPPDACCPSDAATEDSSVSSDAGVPSDAGAASDAGSSDAGAGRDAGSSDAASCDGSCSVTSCGFGSGARYPTELLQFRSGSVEVLIHREAVMQGAGFSTIYELRGFALLREAQLQCLTGGLRYENSHHNWLDHAFAIGAGGIEYELVISFQPEGDPVTSPWVWTFTLRGRASGNEVFAPVALELVSGQP